MELDTRCSAAPRRSQRLVEGIDATLLVLILALSLLGLATLFSASYENPGARRRRSSSTSASRWRRCGSWRRSRRRR